MSKYLIEVKNLTAGYEGEIVIEDVSFNVSKGEIFGILGSSGSGKSTILKHMIGLLKPFAGDVLINGSSIINTTDEEKCNLSKKFGVLYQSGALFSSLTTLENVELPLKEFTKLPANIIRSLAKIKLSMVGMSGTEDYLPFELSGGMKKRASIARAMALNPEILFFDEPSSGLDPIAASDLDKLILDLNKTTNTTMVIVSHDLDSIFSVAKRIIILGEKTKSVIAEGSPEELKQKNSNPWIKKFLTRSYLRS